MKHAAATIGAVAAFLIAAMGAAAAPPRPNDRALTGGTLGTSTAVVHPDDRARHGREPIAPLATITSRAEAGGFDWADAGIGVAGAVGLGLVAAGSYVLVVRRRTAYS